MSGSIPSNPKRTAVSIPARSSGVDTSKTPEEVINEAPLRNADDIKSEEQEQRKPWRLSTNMSEDELMVITEKSSFNIPLELSLRLDYIQSKQKAKGLGRKTNKTALLIEALDSFTRRELKKLGESVD